MYFGYFGWLQSLLFAASLAVPVIMFVRYFVWRGRYDRISRLLDSQNQVTFMLRGRIEALERKLAAGAARAEAPVESVSQAAAQAAPVLPDIIETPAQDAVEEQAAAAAVSAAPQVEEPAVAAREAEALAIPEPVARPPEMPPPRVWPSEPTPPKEEPRRVWPSATSQPEPLQRKVWATSFNDPRPAAPAQASRTPVTPSPLRPPREPSAIAKAFANLRNNPDLEAIIGTSWLNKIGVAVLVIGIALLAGYSLPYIPAWGKIALGAGIGAVLLALGVWLERRKLYTLFARPLIGGGWAVLYFTAYAAHGIEASRIIFDPVLGLFAQVLVAAGMIGHSLRYRSEIVTGFAYLLGFLAILISPVTSLSLVPVALLAASFVVIFRFIPWYRLSAGMVIATYVAIWFWMTQMPPPDSFGWDAYWPIQLILVFYWVVFFAVDYLRKPEEAEQTWLQRFTVAFNSIAFAVLSWLITRNAFPELDSYVISTTAAVASLAVALFAIWRGRRFSHQFHVVLSGIAAAIAIPSAAFSLHWPSGSVQTGWTLLASALIAAGFYRRAISFRIEGYIVGALAVLGAFVLVFLPTFDLGASGSLDTAMPMRLAGILVVALALYAAEVALNRLGDLARVAERQLAPLPGYVATALLAALAFQDVAAAWLGVVWLAGGLVAIELGLRVRDTHWRSRGYALLAGAFAVLMLNNTGFNWFAAAVDAPWRWIILVAAALGYLAVAVRLKTTRVDLPDTERAFYPLIAHASAVLVALVAWMELPTAAVGLAWALLALAYREVGARLKEPAFRHEAYVLIVLAWARLFVVDLVTIGDVAGVSTRILATLPVAAILLYFRHRLSRGAAGEGRTEMRLAPIFSGAAIIALTALCWIELGTTNAVVGWAALALALFGIGVRFKAADYRVASYAVAVLAFGRAMSMNIFLHGQWYGVSQAVATTAPVIGMLLAIGLLWPSRRAAFATDPAASRAVAALDRWSMEVSYLLGVVLTAALVFTTAQSNTIAAALAALALVLFVAGVLLKRWDSRLEAYFVAIFAAGFASTKTILLTGAWSGVPQSVPATLPVIAVLVVFSLAWRERRASLAANAPSFVAPIDRVAILGSSVLATGLTLALLYHTTGEISFPLFLSVLTLVLFGIGVWLGHWEYRLEAYLVALGTTLWTAANTLQLAGNWYGLPLSVVATAPVVAALLAIGLVRRPERIAPPAPLGLVDRWSMPAGSVLAVLLTAALLYQAVDPDGLTIGWAVEALVVIGLGFLLKERALRLSGLALLALCLGKGLVYDVAEAAAILRIISVIVLGAILVGISFVYTRYRHVLRTII